MLCKIVKVDNFRSFMNWRTVRSDPSYKRVNLIYGVNGSGKTTLGALLQLAAEGHAAQAGLEVEVSDGANGSRRVTADTDPFWQKLRVFNRAYVQRTLRFDHQDGTSHTPPLLVLGERQIDADEKIARNNSRIAEIDTIAPRRKQTLNNDIGARTKLLSDCAKRVVEDLQQLGGRYRGTNVYTRSQVRELLSGDRSILAGKSQDLLGDLDIVKARRLDSLPVLTPRLLHLGEHEQRVQVLLSRTVTSQVLDELRENSAGADWVQHGLGLHEERDSCLFCGGVLTKDRRRQLDLHFDEGLKLLQAAIEEAIRGLKSADAEISAVVARLPQARDFYESLQNGYTEAYDSFRADVRQYQQRIAELLKELEAKLGNLFTELPTIPSGRAVEVNLAPISLIIQDHNKRTAEFDANREAAANRVEYYRVADCADEYDRLAESISNVDEVSKREQAERARLQREIEELNQQSEDPLPLAKELTENVARLLGRSELTFSVEAGRYAIERNGEPALALSEGEQTAISLLYFLCSLREHRSEGDDLIVVVDDPVSSLDSNVLVGASAHLWSELVHQSDHQLILLTHNFELFRIWSNQLGRVERFGTKSLVQEVRMRATVDATGGVVRVPKFTAWPNDDFRKRIRSQYHYLFWTTARALSGCLNEPTPVKEMEAIAVIPNVARKMLEGFLSFKYPDKIGDFEGAVQAAISGVNDPARQRIVRFLHHHSHNEEGDIGKGVDPGEAVATLSAVFELINFVDRDHFAAMCIALDVDANSLLAAR
ncbi:AAA family ATPase [Amycolatopsis sp.]|uniref:AAA family ATPase n=1 Tax=Amycolatopsis sp. TaxID=37632 RepID=UPI002BEDF76E|nr:AAA family ATPase [Amycolatopsis sp.]HVV12478.1 AAA family ATPase [Amycolatopsis sp.]